MAHNATDIVDGILAGAAGSGGVGRIISGPAVSSIVDGILDGQVPDATLREMPDIPSNGSIPGLDRDDPEETPWYEISDDGKISIGSSEFEMPADFIEYLQDTGDYKINGPDAERPSYDDWKKAKDPTYDPDSGSIQCPPEIMDAITSAADSAGIEAPYSITIREEDNPELYQKLNELFEAQRQNGIEDKPIDIGDPGIDPFYGRPIPTMAPECMNPLLDPDNRPDVFYTNDEPDIPTVITSEDKPIYIGDPGIDPFYGRPIPTMAPECMNPLLDPDNRPDVFYTNDEPDIPTVITSESNPEFFQQFNERISDLDLDDVFQDIESDAGEKTGSLAALVAADSDFLPPDPIPCLERIACPEQPCPEPVPEPKLFACDLDVM